MEWGRGHSSYLGGLPPYPLCLFLGTVSMMSRESRVRPLLLVVTFKGVVAGRVEEEGLRSGNRVLNIVLGATGGDVLLSSVDVGRASSAEWGPDPAPGVCKWLWGVGDGGPSREDGGSPVGDDVRGSGTGGVAPKGLGTLEAFPFGPSTWRVSPSKVSVSGIGGQNRLPCNPLLVLPVPLGLTCLSSDTSGPE